MKTIQEAGIALRKKADEVMADVAAKWPETTHFAVWFAPLEIEGGVSVKVQGFVNPTTAERKLFETLVQPRQSVAWYTRKA